MEEDARTFKAKVILKYGERTRSGIDLGEDAKLEERSFQQIETPQEGLPAADSVAGGHLGQAPRSGLERDGVRLRGDFPEVAINLFPLSTDLENRGRILDARIRREEIGQEAKIDYKNTHHLICCGAGKEPLKDEPHHGDAEQHAEDAVARNREIGLDGKIAQVDQIKREGNLHARVGEPGTGRGDPCSYRGHAGEEHRESGYGIDLGENKNLGSNSGNDAAKEEAGNAQDLLLARGSDGGEGRKDAGGERGGEVAPVQRHIKHVAEHGRQRSAKNIAEVLGIGEGVEDEDAAGSRRVLEWLEPRIDGMLVAEDGGHQRHHRFNLRQERSVGAGLCFQGCLGGLLPVGAKTKANIGEASLEARGALLIPLWQGWKGVGETGSEINRAPYESHQRGHACAIDLGIAGAGYMTAERAGSHDGELRKAGLCGGRYRTAGGVLGHELLNDSQTGIETF